jgi:hypothetical protein
MGIAALLLGLFVARCGGAPAGVNPQAGPTADSAADLTPLPLELVVLHTNDNWGETEPCG